MNHEYGACLSFEDIDRYVSNLQEMTEEEIYIISRHLGHCEECAERARALRIFDFFWEEWTAEAHGQACSSVTGEKRSAEVEGIKKVLCGKILAAVRVIVNKPGEIMQLLTENIEALAGLATDMKFVAYAGTRGRGVRRPAESRVMAVGETGEKTLLVSGTAGGLEIRMDGFSEGDVPAVLLIAEGMEPLAADIKLDVEREGCWSAIFTDIPQGDYVLTFKSRKS